MNITHPHTDLSDLPSMPFSHLLALSLLDAPDQRRHTLGLSPDLSFLEMAIGQVATGGIYLLGGTPGGGKSLLSVQLALDLARRSIKSLFILTEQGSAHLKRYAQMLSSDWPPADVHRAFGHIYAEEQNVEVHSLPNLITRQVLSPAGRYHGIKLVVLDSIQGHGLPAAASKAYSKVLEFARLCADAAITVLLISHVTKRGEVAGPKMLEHGVDATLVLRRAMNYSLLAVRKNRFGPPMLRPMPLRIDPLTCRLGLAPHTEARPGAARTYAGGGSGLLEIQSAVAVPADGTRGRMTAPGLPRREIEQLVSCIAQVPDMDFGELDYSIHSPARQRTVPGALRPAFVHGADRQLHPQADPPE